MLPGGGWDGISFIGPPQGNNSNNFQLPFRFLYPGQQQSLNQENYNESISRYQVNNRINGKMWIINIPHFKKYFLIYPRVFYPAIITMVLFITIVIIGGSAVEEFFKHIHGTVTKYTSWLFIVGVNLFVLTSLWVAFGKYGQYKLGGKDTQPEFSLFSWLSMLFSAGLGIGLLYYGVYETISHYVNTPIETLNEPQKAIQSLSLTYLH